MNADIAALLDETEDIVNAAGVRSARQTGEAECAAQGHVPQTKKKR